MALLWPGFLIMLACIPLLAAAYLWLLRRRKRSAVRYSSLALVRSALPKGPHWRRYVPPALFLLAIASLIVAAARPTAIVNTPENYSTVILAIDVSNSMALTDIPPSRLGAAQAAALSFVHSQEPNTRIGLVAFAGFSQLVVPPTTNQKALETAIRGLTTGPMTAIGEGIFTSLKAIAAADPTGGDTPITGRAGGFAPAAIVLLTDGSNNCCREPTAAARIAAQRGVRIYTIGFGTRSSQPENGLGSSGQQLLIPSTGGREFSYNDIDETTLKEIASITEGHYYPAGSASELEKIFSGLATSQVNRPKIEEISFVFTAFGAGLVAAAMMLSMLWHPLP